METPLVYSNQNQQEKEIAQLKELNKKLVSENWDLQEQLQLWDQKHKVELAVGNDAVSNANKLESMIQKSTANYWMKRLNKHMSQLNRQHQDELQRITQSFGHQIDDLNLALSELSLQSIWIKQRLESEIHSLKNTVEEKNVSVYHITM